MGNMLFFNLRIYTPSYTTSNQDMFRIPYKTLAHGITLQTFQYYNGTNLNKGVSIMATTDGNQFTFRTADIPPASSNFCIAGCCPIE